MLIMLCKSFMTLYLIYVTDTYQSTEIYPPCFSSVIIKHVKEKVSKEIWGTWSWELSNCNSEIKQLAKTKLKEVYSKYLESIQTSLSDDLRKLFVTFNQKQIIQEYRRSEI